MLDGDSADGCLRARLHSLAEAFSHHGCRRGGKSSLGIMTKIIAVATGRKVLDWLLFETV